MAVMNSTYTLTAYYNTSIPRLRAADDIEHIELIDPATIRVRKAADIYLPTNKQLLCRSADVQDVLNTEDGATFPVHSAAQAIYRPLDKCQWRITMPDAGMSFPGKCAAHTDMSSDCQMWPAQDHAHLLQRQSH
jgi:hypothetical protein